MKPLSAYKTKIKTTGQGDWLFRKEGETWYFVKRLGLTKPPKE